MKKTFLSLLCLAAAAMTFTACSDVDDFEPNRGNNGRVLTVIAQNPSVQEDTRTGISIDANSAVKPIWTAGDRLIMLADDKEMFAASDNLNENAEKASFIFKQTPSSMESPKEIFFTNANADKKWDENGRFYLEIRALSYVHEEGKPLYNELKPNFMHPINDILVSDGIDPSTIKANQPLEIKLKRISSVLRINLLNGSGDTDVNKLPIDKVILGPEDEKDPNLLLLKDIMYYPDTDEIKLGKGQYPIKFYHTAGNKEFYLDSEGESLYAACAPCTIKKDTKLPITLYLRYNGQSIAFTMTLKMKEDVKLEPGKITTFNIKFIPDVPGR